MGSGTIARHLKIARKNSSVKAVVLRIDSPGGSARAAEEIRRETELLAKEKPLVISMSDLAASGGVLDIHVFLTCDGASANDYRFHRCCFWKICYERLIR